MDANIQNMAGSDGVSIHTGVPLRNNHKGLSSPWTQQYRLISE